VIHQVKAEIDEIGASFDAKVTKSAKPLVVCSRDVFVLQLTLRFFYNNCSCCSLNQKIDGEIEKLQKQITRITKANEKKRHEHDSKILKIKTKHASISRELPEMEQRLQQTMLAMQKLQAELQRSGRLCKCVKPAPSLPC